MSVRLGHLAALAAAVSPVFAADANEASLVSGNGIAISGAISNGLRLTWRLDYETTVPKPACQFSDDVTGMMIPRVHSEFLAPAVRSGQHQAEIAISRPVAPECGWALRTAYACTAISSSPAGEIGNCFPVLILGAASAGRSLDLKLDCASETSCAPVDPAYEPQPFARIGQNWTINLGQK